MTKFNSATTHNYLSQITSSIPTWHTERPLAPRWKGESDCTFNSIYVAVGTGALSCSHLCSNLVSDISFTLTNVSVLPASPGIRAELQNPAKW